MRKQERKTSKLEKKKGRGRKQNVENAWNQVGGKEKIITGIKTM